MCDRSVGRSVGGCEGASGKRSDVWQSDQRRGEPPEEGESHKDILPIMRSWIDPSLGMHWTGSMEACVLAILPVGQAAA